MKKIQLIIFSFVFISQASAQDIPVWQDLMPRPSHITIRKGNFKLDSLFKVAIPELSSRRVQIAATKFIRRVTDRTGLFVQNGFPVAAQSFPQASILVQYKRKGKLKIHEDESYQININSKQVVIQANTDLGIVYAFETLLQLLDNDKSVYFFQNLNIIDKPAFTWRGLMIDASRHFQPVSVIKRNLDAMLVAKLNTFHWHLSDDQGFRVEIKKYPQLTQKASDRQFYTQAQIKDIIQYASDRGIRVIPEIDVPGHATALLTAFPEIASQRKIYKLQRNAGIFDPTLDPTNPKTYEILENIFKEMSSLFPFDYIHIGGDENRGKHWDTNPEIQRFMKKKHLKTNHQLQTFFNIKLQRILKKYNKKLMGWEEIRSPQMPKTALIHVWRGKAGESLTKTVKNGYKAVLSNGFYIDLMLPASTHYKTQLYPNNQLNSQETNRILGGEATMWSELVTSLTIDSRIWPRSLVIGERLWTNPSEIDIYNMYKRMFAQSYHLEELGITHLRNKDVILRNITQNQDINSLRKLSDLYEPLKGYTRNKGGTEYQNYSPFRLFADACSADAKEAIKFNFLVQDYLNDPEEKYKKEIISYLKLWQQLHKELLDLKPNPKLKEIIPMAKSLETISADLLYLSNQSNSIDKSFIVKLHKDFDKAFIPYNDVRLATKDALNKLISYWCKNQGYIWQ